ncbi:MAG: SIS domain-containing protein [Alphaproteobacteria bacterium]
MSPDQTAPHAASALADADDLEEARRVLRLEARGIEAVADQLDGGFRRALDLLLAVEGRVIVTGMGKSGHVARKIAATLASTGSPAQYVHPGEASHGDLGMITRRDAVLALSNSGGTVELADLVAHAARIGIPLVAMTARAASPLAEAATVALVLPAVEEGCPMGLAPTTSTTMMLALGDALAVALLRRRGFSSRDFQLLHPGGSLGHRLKRVRQIMHAADEMPLVGPGAAMSEAIVVMSARSFGCVGVVGDGGALVGILTDGDLRRHMGPDLLSRRVGEVMTAGPKVIRPDALVEEALAAMNDAKITSLFVVADGRPVGILHVHDCLRAGVA